MGLFDAFRKKPWEKRADEAYKRAMREDLEVYSGMRVEVTSSDGRVFLVARLLELRGDRAQLEPGFGIQVDVRAWGGQEALYAGLGFQPSAQARRGLPMHICLTNQMEITDRMFHQGDDKE